MAKPYKHRTHPSTTRMKIKLKEDENARAAAEKAAVVGGTLASLGATASIVDSVAKAQLEEFNRHLWNPVFSQTANADTPINQMVIACAHNSGTEPGSGTLFFNQSQTLSPYELLSQTPARALEFQVEDDHGTLITNHGAAMGEFMINHGVSTPETLNSQLESVKQWLTEPQNSDQVVILQLANNAHDPHDQRTIDELLRHTFGNQLFDISDYYRAENQGAWPTINQLVSENKHVIVLASGMGYYNSTIPSHEVMTEFLNPVANAPPNMQWHAFGEDRTLAGNLVGNAATSHLPDHQQFVGSLNTEQVDHTIQAAQGHGAIIKLDQLAPNDPRLVAPEMRDQLGHEPNVSLFNGLIQIDRGHAATAIFGIGVATDIGAGTLAITESSLRAYQNFRFIQEAEENFLATLKQADVVDLTAFQQRTIKTKSPYPINLSPEEVTAFCRESLLDKITTDTVTAGAIGTTSLAGALFSAGLLFPFLFPLTSALTILTLAAGTLATSIATYFNRKALNDKLDKLLAKPELQHQLELKTAFIKNSVNKAETTHYHKRAKSKEKDSFLSSTSNALLGTTLLLRISALAKFAVATIGTLASGLTTLAMYFRSALDAVINYRNRQNHLDNLPRLISQIALPTINRRSYIFFGETEFEKYIRLSKKQLIQRHRLPAEFKELTVAQFIDKLSSSPYKADLHSIRQEAITNLIVRDIENFCQTEKIKYESSNREILNKYLLNRVEDYIARDVRASGRANTFKIAMATWIGGTFFAPIFSGVFAGVALVIMAIGEIVTRFVAKAETEKFKIQAHHLMDQVSTETYHKDPAVAELASYIDFVQAELKKNASEQLQAASSSSTIKVHSHIRKHKHENQPKYSHRENKLHPNLLKKAHTVPLFKKATSGLTAESNTSKSHSEHPLKTRS